MSTPQDFTITNDEYSRLKQSFQNPEFRNLFMQYMNDLSDPKYREEQEKYFAQLAEEEETKRKEGSGPLTNPMLNSQDSRRIILPKAEYGFSVPLQDDSARVFINVCSNDAIAKYQTVPDVKSNSVQYSMPLSMGREQIEEDGKVLVYDVVFHPETVETSRRDPFVMKTVMEICCEHVEMNYRKTLGRAGTVYNVRWEEKCHGKPLAQTIRVKPTQENGAKKSSSQQEPETITFPKKAPEQPKKQTKAAPEEAPTPAAASILRNLQSAKKPQESSTNAESLNDDLYKTFSSAILGEEHKAPELDSLNTTTSKKAVKIEELPYKSPKYVIVHSGTFQIQNYTMSKVDLDRNIPEKLIVKITLPELSSAKTIDLEMTTQNLFLSEPTYNYKLDLSLPFPVDSDEGTAKWLKKTNTLVVTLPVNIPRDQLTPADAPAWEKDSTPVINENEEFERERQERIKAYQQRVEEERQEKLREKQEYEKRVRHEREQERERAEEERQRQEEEKRRKREEEEALQRMLRDEKSVEKPAEKKPAPAEDNNDEAALRQIKEEKARAAAQKTNTQAESYESQYFNIDFENKYISEID